MLPETFWAWLAGFIDGDGHLGIHPAGATLEIVNTDVETLVWIRDTFGFGSITELKPGSGRQRQAYKWSCYANGMRLILPKITPHLHTKKERAELLLEYISRAKPGVKRTEEEKSIRQELRDRMAKLNHRTYALPHPADRPLGGASKWAERF